MQERPESLGPERGRNSSAIVWGGLAVLLGGLLLYLLYFQRGGVSMPAEEDQPAIGRSLSALKLAPLTGDVESLQLADLREKEAVLINYWGPWCGWCMVEMPELIELRDALKREDRFDMLLVSCSYGSGVGEDVERLRSDTEAALQRFDSPPPTYHDPDAFSRIALVETAQIAGFGYPTTVLIDGQGVIHGLWSGYSSDAVQQMREEIDRLLAN